MHGAGRPLLPISHSPRGWGALPIIGAWSGPCCHIGGVPWRGVGPWRLTPSWDPTCDRACARACSCGAPCGRRGHGCGCSCTRSGGGGLGVEGRLAAEGRGHLKAQLHQVTLWRRGVPATQHGAPDLQGVCRHGLLGSSSRHASAWQFRLPCLLALQLSAHLAVAIHAGVAALDDHGRRGHHINGGCLTRVALRQPDGDRNIVLG